MDDRADVRADQGHPPHRRHAGRCDPGHRPRSPKPGQPSRAGPKFLAMTKIRALATTFAITVAAVAASACPATAAGAQTLTVPDGISAGIMVFDRHTDSVELQYNAHQQFRSASVVKLMIALD